MKKSYLVVGILFFLVAISGCTQKITQSSIVGNYDFTDYDGGSGVMKFKNNSTVIVDYKIISQSIKYKVDDKKQILTLTDISNGDKTTYKISRDDKKNIVLTAKKFISDGNSESVEKKNYISGKNADYQYKLTEQD